MPQRIETSVENQTILTKIKKDLLGKTFEGITITKINETNDGRGFWWHSHRKFGDGSEGDFRYFSHFEDYVYKDFVHNMRF